MCLHSIIIASSTKHSFTKCDNYVSKHFSIVLCFDTSGIALFSRDRDCYFALLYDCYRSYYSTYWHGKDLFIFYCLSFFLTVFQYIIIEYLFKRVRRAQAILLLEDFCCFRSHGVKKQMRKQMAQMFSNAAEAISRSSHVMENTKK